jgi:hypothetical protein
MSNGIPFELKIIDTNPTAIGGLTREQLDNELMKSIDSLKCGKVYSTDEIDEEFSNEYDA